MKKINKNESKIVYNGGQRRSVDIYSRPLSELAGYLAGILNISPLSSSLQAQLFFQSYQFY